jgi:hypothetical protein
VYGVPGGMLYVERVLWGAYYAILADERAFQ